MIFIHFGFIFFFLKCTFIINDFYPFSQNIQIDSEMKKSIISSFTKEKKIINLPENKKNLIFVLVESLELQALGVFNKKSDYNCSMPFMSKLSQQATICTNVSSQPYTTWSAAGFMVTHCSFPHIVSEVSHKSRPNELLTQWNKIPCITDFLKQAGYNVQAISDNTLNFQGQKAFMMQHGMSCVDKHVHKFNSDFELYHYLSESVVPTLVKKYKEESQPFSLTILNEDTHPAYRYSKKCTHLNPKLTRALQSYTCYDEAFSLFYDTIYNKYGLNENNTVMIICGDHLSMGFFGDSFQNDRKLVILFPFMKKNMITKPITYYDIAPTLLDLLGIKYHPKFPFGENIFNDKIGTFPKTAEINFLYDFVVKKTVKKNSKCHGKEGLCTSNES